MGKPLHPESCVLPWAGHMADKIILPLTSGISGMLQGAEAGSPAKRDNYKWSG